MSEPYVPSPALSTPLQVPRMRRTIVVEPPAMGLAWVGVGTLLAIGVTAIVLGTKASGLRPTASGSSPTRNNRESGRGRSR